MIKGRLVINKAGICERQYEKQEKIGNYFFPTGMLSSDDWFIWI